VRKCVCVRGNEHRWKKCGFWPVYALAIDPNVVFFAWRAAGDEAGGAAAAAAAAAAAQGDKFMRGDLSYTDFVALIMQRPPLATIIPSVLGPVINKTPVSYEKKVVLGWFGVGQFEAMLRDESYEM
jgi:hypothetical protein